MREAIMASKMKVHQFRAMKTENGGRPSDQSPRDKPNTPNMPPSSPSYSWNKNDKNFVEFPEALHTP
jgi:hypothetical protein